MESDTTWELFHCAVDEITKNESFHMDIAAIEATQKILAEAKKISDYLHTLERVHLGLCLVAMLVSMMNVIVLAQKTMRRCSLNKLLVTLELLNMIVSIILSIVIVLKLYTGESERGRNAVIFNEVCLVAALIGICSINWLTVIISFWRFVGIKWPLKALRMLTNKLATRVICVLFFICIPLTVGCECPLYYVLETSIPICSDLVNKTLTKRKVYSVRTQWNELENLYNIARILYCFVPAICFAVLTVCLLVTVCLSQKRTAFLMEGQSFPNSQGNGKQTTAIIVILLLSYLLGNAFGFVIMLFANKNWRVPISFTSRVVLNTIDPSFLSQIINIFSFHAYYYMGTNFRSTFWALFGR